MTAKPIIGWVLTAVPALFVGSGGIRKAMMSAVPEDIAKGMAHLGVDPGLLRTIGILEIVVVALLLVPRTAFIGAILFTGWAGGTVMTHLRVGDPVVLQALLPVVVWVGLGLRREQDLAPLLGFRPVPRG